MQPQTSHAIQTNPQTEFERALGGPSLFEVAQQSGNFAYEAALLEGGDRADAAAAYHKHFNREYLRETGETLCTCEACQDDAREVQRMMERGVFF